MLCSCKYSQYIQQSKLLTIVSGKTAEDPVICRKSGAVYDRRLIEAYINAHGKDPISDEDITIEDLTSIKGVPDFVPPQLTSSSSIPNLLKTFQNEWDALALEVFSLRKQLHTARQELSSSLYHYDAAVRVAAKATEERDEAQRALKELSQAVGAGTAQVSKTSTRNGTSDDHAQVKLEDIAEELEHEREALFAEHKAQKKTTKQFTGILQSISIGDTISLPFKSLAVAAYRDGKLCLASTAGSVTVLDIQDPDNTTKIVRKGKPSAADFILEDSNLVPVVTYKDKIYVGSLKSSIQNSGEITAIASHPTLNYFVVVGPTGWLLANSNTIIHLGSGSYKSVAFHIDGKLIAIGSDSLIDIVDISTTEKVASVDLSNIIKMKFAPNGYWLLALNQESLLVVDIRTQAVVGNIPGTFDDFVIDPTSTAILAINGKQSKLYKFSKADKQWSKEPVHGVENGIRSIFVTSSANNEDYLLTGDLNFVGVGTNVQKGTITKE